MLAEPDRTRADVAWKMLGIPVRVHPFFWVMCLLTGYDGSTSADALLVWIAVVLVSVLVHEFGHALTARTFGARGTRVVLWGMGGLAIHNGGGLRRWQRIIELLMGPGAGFLLALAAYLVAKGFGLAGGQAVSHLVNLAVWDLIVVNIYWGIVNLVPVFPLDGGQVMLEVCRQKRPNDGVLLALKLSIVAALVVSIGSGVLYVTLGVPTVAMLMFLLLAYFNFQALQQLKAQGHGMGDDRMGHEREAWESDPDAWKRG